jgi:hypothetical protein
MLKIIAAKASYIIFSMVLFSIEAVDGISVYEMFPDIKPKDFSTGYDNNPFMGNSFSRGRNGQADNYNDNLYLEHDDEVINREVVGDVEYYTYTLKGYMIYLRVQEKK